MKHADHAMVYENLLERETDLKNKDDGKEDRPRPLPENHVQQFTGSLWDKRKQSLNPTSNSTVACTSTNWSANIKLNSN